jgi:predicted nuclease of predicted toxin-antitoxin system
MQWLLHGLLDPAVAEALRRHGHQVHAFSDLSVPAGASPIEILKAARERQWDIMTRDIALSYAPYEAGDPFPRTIVYLQLEGGDVEQDDAIDRLFKRYKRLSPRRLYTVTGTRVKIRQLPGAP